MAKENQRITISKHLLKASLLRLLQKKHISKISISELCQEAEINRTTFYRHYETPSDVLLEISLDYIQDFLNFSFPLCESPNLKSEILKLCRFVYNNADIAKLLMRNSSVEDIPKVFHKLYESFAGSRQILYKGQPVDHDTLYLLEAFLASGIYTIIDHWLMENIPKTPEEVADLICCSINTDFTFI